MGEVVEESGRYDPEEEIDAGVVGELSDLPFHKAKHHAETAKQLALLLVWIMAISVGVHYGLTAYFAAIGQADTIESLAQIFNIWLPVISSSVGAAATYYFTKEKS